MHKKYHHSWWDIYDGLAFLLIAILAFPVFHPAYAAGDGDEVRIYLRSIAQLYKDLDYERALEQIGRAKKLVRRMDDEVTLSLYEGIILSELNRRQEATAAFRSALLLQPEVILPLLVSPKMSQHFETLRAQVKRDLSTSAGTPSAEQRRAKAQLGIRGANSGLHIVDSAQSATHAKKGDTVSFRVEAKDSQGLPLGFSWSASVGTLNRSESTKTASTVTWTPPACTSAGDTPAITATITSAQGSPTRKSFQVKMICPRFSPIASMSSVRRQHTASLLSSRKLLIAGGEGGEGGRKPVASAEVYALDTGAWEATGPMNFARRFHTASLLSSGKVLVVGGHSGGAYLDTAEIYDPAIGTWLTTGRMISSRAHHTASVLLSGKILVVGGYNGSSLLATAEVYDPEKGSWKAINSMRSPRAYHTASVLPSGKVLMVGGINGDKSLATAELYDPEFETWISIRSMSSARRHHTASVLPSGKVLIVGGDDGTKPLATAEMYDPDTGRWTPAGNMSWARQYHTASVLPSGKVLVTGGRGSTCSDTAEEYDSATGTWRVVGLMNSARQEHTSSVLPSGELLIMGGAIDLSTLATAEKYTP